MSLFRSGIAGMILLLTGLWIAGQVYFDKPAAGKDASSFSSGAGGSSVFRQLIESVKPDKIQLMRRALLHETDLEQVGTYLLLSPGRQLTARESGFLKTFVRSGGRLVISLHMNQKQNTSYITDRFLNLFPVKIAKGFSNGNPTIVSASGNNVLEQPGERYAFYSLHEFQEDCTGVQSSCFQRVFQYGEGELVLWLGIHPLSNALIGLQENRQLAFRLLEKEGKILFDEYHHFFTEKTFKDLLLVPEFFLPIAGLALLGLSYLVFGYSAGGGLNKTRPHESFVPGIHDVAIGVITGAITHRGYREQAVEDLKCMLEKLYPESTADLMKNHNIGAGANKMHLRQTAAKMLYLHQKHFRNRGSKGK